MSPYQKALRQTLSHLQQTAARVQARQLLTGSTPFDQCIINEAERLVRELVDAIPEISATGSSRKVSTGPDLGTLLHCNKPL